MSSGSTDDDIDPDVEAWAEGVAAWYLSRRRRILRWQDRAQRRFRRSLRRHWGRALRLYLLTWNAAAELGSLVNDECRSTAAAREDYVFEALVRLHARACRVAREVHDLLSAGGVAGALARCRTLHEIAVFADVIGEYGRKPEYSGLAEKYLLHEGVLAYADAVRYQRHCATLGQIPFSDDELEQMHTVHDALIERFGPSYRGTYGWANELPRNSPNRMEFSDLTHLAQAGHLEPYFRWASHEIHADAKGAHWATVQVAEGTVLLTGGSTDGLVEPASLALTLLNRCTASLVEHGPISPRLNYLISLRAIGLLLDRTNVAFLTGHESHQVATERTLSSQWRRASNKWWIIYSRKKTPSVPVGTISSEASQTQTRRDPRQ